MSRLDSLENNETSDSDRFKGISPVHTFGRKTIGSRTFWSFCITVVFVLYAIYQLVLVFYLDDPVKRGPQPLSQPGSASATVEMTRPIPLEIAAEKAQTIVKGATSVLNEASLPVRALGSMPREQAVAITDGAKQFGDSREAPSRWQGEHQLEGAAPRVTRGMMVEENTIAPGNFLAGRPAGSSENSVSSFVRGLKNPPDVSASLANALPSSEQQSAAGRTSPDKSVLARRINKRSFFLARGAYIPCVLETQLVSSIPGPVQCILETNIYSDNGSVLLLEKGSRALGEYASLRAGADPRLSVIWQRIKTPSGVIVDLDSIGTDPLGGVGLTGDMDSKWMHRFGQAILVSLIQDAVTVGVTTRGPNGSSSAGFYPQNTFSAASSLPSKIFESSTGIAPVLTKNRGERLLIFVAKDLSFDSVYELEQTFR